MESTIIEQPCIICIPDTYSTGSEYSTAGCRDFRASKCRYIQLLIDSPGEAMQWQKSYDKKVWFNLRGKTQPLLNILVDENVFLRAAVRIRKGNRITSEILRIIPVEPPQISTLDMTRVTSGKLICGWSLLSDGGDTVTERGICVSIHPEPTITDRKTQLGKGIGTFFGVVKHVEEDNSGGGQNASLYLRAYAINTAGISYGEIKEFQAG